MDYCYGYIDGLADDLFAHKAIDGFTACMTPPPDDSQLRDLVVQFLHKNPGLRSDSAPALVARALSEAFPCH